MWCLASGHRHCIECARRNCGPWVKWVGAAAVCTHTHLCMPTLKDEEVIKWLHSLSPPPWVLTREDLRPSFQEIVGEGKHFFAPWPIPFSWYMNMKQCSTTDWVSNLQSFMIVLLLLPKKNSERWINQPHNQFTLVLLMMELLSHEERMASQWGRQLWCRNNFVIP